MQHREVEHISCAHFLKMRIGNLQSKRGVAGLEILISLIATLFVAGVLVMAFLIAGSKLEDTASDTATANVYNETIASVDNVTGEDLAHISTAGVACSITRVTNATDGVAIVTGNWTASGVGSCHLTAVGWEDGITNENWNVTYSYDYTEDVDAVEAINDTGTAISTVTDWFDTFIVIGAVVVLVLLIVLVIMAIRRAGLMGGGGA